MAAYREALTRDKTRADAYQRLAILHDRRGDFRRSAELYRQALEAAPGSAEIYCDKGYSLYLQRRWAEAETNLKQAIALRPDLARAHNNLGLVLAHDCRPEEALAEYRKAGNDEAQARGNLALALAVEGNVDEARAQYRLALAADPNAAGPKERLRELDALAARSTPPAAKGAPAPALAARPAPAPGARDGPALRRPEGGRRPPADRRRGWPARAPGPTPR
jgi:Tfp pilus assembly protein PilF